MSRSNTPKASKSLLPRQRRRRRQLRWLMGAVASPVLWMTGPAQAQELKLNPHWSGELTQWVGAAANALQGVQLVVAQTDEPAVDVPIIVIRQEGGEESGEPRRIRARIQMQTGDADARGDNGNPSDNAQPRAIRSNQPRDGRPGADDNRGPQRPRRVRGRNVDGPLTRPGGPQGPGGMGRFPGGPLGMPGFGFGPRGLRPEMGRPDGPRPDEPPHDRPQHDGPQHDGPHHDGPHHDGPHHDGPHHDGPHHDGPHHDGPHHDGPGHDPAFAVGGPMWERLLGMETDRVRAEARAELAEEKLEFFRTQLSERVEQLTRELEQVHRDMRTREMQAEARERMERTRAMMAKPPQKNSVFDELLGKMKAQLMEAKQAAQGLQQERDKLLAELEATRGRQEEMERGMRARMEEMERGMRARAEEMERECSERAKAALQRQGAELEELRAALAERGEQLKGLEGARAELEELRGLMGGRERELDELRGVVEDQRRRMEELERENRGLAERLERATAERRERGRARGRDEDREREENADRERRED